MRWFPGVPSPVKHPEKVDMVIFRENTEDIYAGLEVEEGTPEAKKLIELLHDSFGWNIRPDSGHRHQAHLRDRLEAPDPRRDRVRRQRRNRKSVTLVHKGNIQKFTEGAFMNWGYELTRDEFSDVAVGWDDCGGKPGDKILVKDAIADITLQQVLTRPDEFDVIATTNLNGDYLSDALAAQVGGIGIAPGGNINYVTGHGVFEATHGTAPKYAGQDKVNPGSVLLSGVMMFEHLGWQDAADDIVAGPRGDDRRQDRHLRLRPPDGRRDRGEDARSSRRRSSTACSCAQFREHHEGESRFRRETNTPDERSGEGNDGARRAERPTHAPAQPTRRVAIGDVYLPTSGPGYGAILLGAVVAEHLPDLDEEQRELAPRLLAEARDGLSVPRIAMRYRLQTDLHGLDRSRHRIVGEAGRVVLELDRHGWPDPQVIGAVMAAAALPSSTAGHRPPRRRRRAAPSGAAPGGAGGAAALPGHPRHAALRAGRGPDLRPVAPGRHRPQRRQRRSRHGLVGRAVRAAVGDGGARPARRDAASTGPTSRRRFRRLVRQAHPDHGGAHLGAAERLAELSEARELLLGAIASARVELTART